MGHKAWRGDERMARPDTWYHKYLLLREMIMVQTSWQSMEFRGAINIAHACALGRIQNRAEAAIDSLSLCFAPLCWLRLDLG